MYRAWQIVYNSISYLEYAQLIHAMITSQMRETLMDGNRGRSRRSEEREIGGDDKISPIVYCGQRLYQSIIEQTLTRF